MNGAERCLCVQLGLTPIELLGRGAAGKAFLASVNDNNSNYQWDGAISNSNSNSNSVLTADGKCSGYRPSHVVIKSIDENSWHSSFISLHSLHWEAWVCECGYRVMMMWDVWTTLCLTKS